MSIHLADTDSLPYIVDLSRRFATEVGFIPRSAMEAYITRGRVTLATQNGDSVGYFLTSGLNHHTRIFQAAVQLDARGLRQGLDLLGELVTRSAFAGTKFLTLHCRDGLESNGFWSACGFQLDGLIPGGHARRKIVCNWRLEIDAALRNPSLPYGRRFLSELRGRATPREIAAPLRTAETAGT